MYHYTIKQVLLIFIAFFFANNVLSQKNVKFEYISLSEGLSQSSVVDIHRDKQGYMWFATLDGLNKYNGYSVEIFRTNPLDSTTIADNSISCIHEFKNRYLWIGHSSAGLSVYDKIKERFYEIEQNEMLTNTLISNKVNSIQSDYSANIWIGTDKGVSKISKINFKKQKYKIENIKISGDKPESEISVNKIIRGKKPMLYLATNKGVYKLNYSSNEIEKLSNNSKCDTNINDILLQSDSILWIASDNGLIKFLLKSEKVRIFKNKTDNLFSLSHNEVSSLALDYDNTLWVGTKDGLNHFFPETDKFISFKNSIFNPEGLNSSEILSLFIDEQKILWVGTSLGGVNKWNRPAKQFRIVKNIPFDNTSLSSNKIRSFFQTPDSLVWIGTVDAGVNIWNKKNGTFKHIKSSASPYTVSHNHIRGIARDKKGNMWLGTSGNGVDFYDYRTKRFTNFNSSNSNLPFDDIWAIFVDSKNRLWVGTLGGGLCYLNLDNYFGASPQFTVLTKENSDLSGDKISCIVEDKDSFIWVGTRENGLNKITGDLKNIKQYRFLNDDDMEQNVDRVYSIIEDPEGVIWVGTRGSLNKYLPEKDEFQKFDYVEYGFPNPIMMGLVDDNAGHIWVSTNRGIAVFDKKAEKVRNYDVTDGLQSNEFMIGAYYKTFDGQILFGGQTGFNAFYPKKIKDNEHEPKALLTKFLLFNELHDCDSTIFMKKQINLNFDENTFTFEFVGIDYVNPLQNKYEYKLEGFDKDWQRVDSRRFASYTNIAPGEYTFLLKVSNNDGKWCAEPAAVKISIEPPFWKTSWFGITATIFILALGYALLRFRDVLRDKSELEQKVIQRTEEVVRQKEAIQEKNEELQQQQEEIMAQRDELERQRDISEERRVALMDSITYAERIQQAILPPSEILEKRIPEHFILYKPRDIVSGDYYWMTNKGDKLIVTAADCTGHGVPGAFLSMLGVSFLNEIVGKQEVLVAADILGRLREKLIESLHQTGQTNEAKDGMDLALCVIDRKKMELQFAGAYNPLFLYRLKETAEEKREFIEIKADRMPVGISDKGTRKFQNHVLNVKKGDAIYMFSDGYADQFGGPKNKKFKIKTFKSLLYDVFDKPMPVQKQILNKTLLDWKQNYEQIDDILVMGIRI